MKLIIRLSLAVLALYFIVAGLGTIITAAQESVRVHQEVTQRVTGNGG